MTVNPGDEITINGVVVKLNDSHITVRIKSGGLIYVTEGDINTIHPKESEITEDKRKGN